MTELSYREYLEYMQLEFKDIDPSSLSEEDLVVYEIVKKELNDTKNIPTYVLNASLLPKSKILDSETVKNLEYIKDKISLKNKVGRFLKSVLNPFQQLDSIGYRKQMVQYVSIPVSFLIVFILTSSFPLNIKFNLPNFNWEISNRNIVSTEITPIPTEQNSVIDLSGSAGSGESPQKVYEIRVTWEAIILNIVYILWVIPLFLTFLAIYPELKKVPNINKKQ